jgi:UDP-2,3-diacylglucosamine hydrolase
MRTIFISDAHLKWASDERYIKLLKFFSDIIDGKICSTADSGSYSGSTARIDDLYIVGDLFDFWFCEKKKINPEFMPVINKLSELQNAGIRVHLGEGNHDFFMAEYFCDVLGMDVFDEWTASLLGKSKVFVAHGDTADSANSKYIILRKILRSRTFYNFQRFIPASIRWRIASLSSTVSKEMTIEDGNELVTKMLPFAREKFKHDYDAVVLGHCHVPALRILSIDHKEKIFVTLGDWISHYSYLCYENGIFSLKYYRN